MKEKGQPNFFPADREGALRGGEEKEENSLDEKEIFFM